MKATAKYVLVSLKFRAGRSKEIMGLCDTTLSSGSWSVSGSNLGIPEVEISVPEFFIIPWLGQLFAFKGNFSHGWMGDPLRAVGAGMKKVILYN